MVQIQHSNATKQKEDVIPFFAVPNLLYGINLGILAALINAFLHISLYASFTLFFGPVLVLICLATRGLNAAIITAFISSISAAIYGQDAYLIVIFMLEMFVVHMLMRRGFFLFQSASLYWLIIGIPLIFTLHAISSFDSAEFLFINSITRGINGLICLSFASVVCWFLPRNLLYTNYSKKPPRLASLIFSLCMITVTLPSMVVASFFIWQTTSSNEQIIAKSLKSTSEQARVLNNLEISRHLNAINTLASIMQASKSIQVQPLLNATNNHYPLFESLFVTDEFGRILQAVPSTFKRKLFEANITTVRELAYFQEAQNSLEPLVSEAVVNRKMGEVYSFSIVAPLFNSGQFDGLVQGAILLDTFNAFNQARVDTNYSFVITDTNGRIVSRSHDLSLPLLSNFDVKIIENPLVQTLPILEINQQQFLYSQSQTEQNWTITILTSPKKITSVIFDFLFLLVVATFFMLAAFAFIANTLARKITQPLVDIAEHFPVSEDDDYPLEESQVSSEMLTLTHRLLDSHKVMSNFQQQLSEQVNNKTKQLKQLNQELYSLAQKDSLTQLYNRAGFNRLALSSYRNCIRHKINISLVLIDIDHFKTINDTHGHPFGDKCIIAVAKTIQHHCKRDTDIIGRYGGEEFIILLSGGEIDEHAKRIKMIKNHIESLSFKHNASRVNMTVSAGICSLSNSYDLEYDDMLQKADEQLYLSKREGRNKINSIIY